MVVKERNMLCVANELSVRDKLKRGDGTMLECRFR